MTIACRLKMGLLLAALAMASVAPAFTEPMDSKAPQVLLIDDRSDTILLSKNPDKTIPPASLAKLMTAEVVFAALSKGEITMEQTFAVSENAWRTGGAPSGTSTMFAKIKSTPRVEDLLQGMIVQLANDACIILAEGIAGSEAAFAIRMNERAIQLGLNQSVFVNSTGLPAEGQFVTLSELVTLARHIHRAYPQFYKYYAQDAFRWNNISQHNRNPLLKLNIGADGLGTGYAKNSGYALVGSAEQNGRRLFLAMSGLATDKERAEEARKLMQWGMTEFEDVRLFSAGTIVADAGVYGGAQSSVTLIVKDDFELLLAKQGRETLRAEVDYIGPLRAPLAQGDEIGTLRIMMGNTLVKEKPLFVGQTVAQGSLQERALGALFELSTGWIRKYR